MAWYQEGKLVIFDASADTDPPVSLLSDTIKVALMKTTYTPSATTDDHFNDIAASEIVATGYTSRGFALASKTLVRDDGNTRVEFDAADSVFTIGNGTNDTFDKVVYLRETPTTASTDANSVLLGWATVASTTTNGTQITLQYDAEGIMRVA